MHHTSPSGKAFNSGLLIVLSFAAIIAAGTLLLMLPVSSANAQPLPFLDSLFTAASAVCVTGLSVINVSETLSRFGQIVLMCLIQMGGLGLMVFSTLIFVFVVVFYMPYHWQQGRGIRIFRWRN